MKSGNILTNLLKADREAWGPYLREIQSLSKETDPELFYEALLHLGKRLEKSGKVEQAGLVYSAIASIENVASPIHPFPHSPIPLQEARERLEILRGGGSLGIQLEHMGSTFTQTALDPGMLLGGTGMGLFGKGMEVLAMGWLSKANFFRKTIGIGRTTMTVLPKFGGFAAEASTFPFAVNGANALLGRPTTWGRMDERVLSSWFFLGGMRMGGGLGASASRRLGVSGLQTVGSIAGIMAGHGAEVAYGLKDWHGLSNFTVEAVGTWANLQVAGQYSDRVFGGRISQMRQIMDLQAEELELLAHGFAPVRGGHDGPQKNSSGEISIPDYLQKILDKTGWAKGEIQFLLEALRTASAAEELPLAYKDLAKAISALEPKWSPEERYPLLSFVMRQAERGVVGALQRFPEGLAAVETTDWSREQKKELILLLAEKGGKYVGAAFGALPAALRSLQAAGLSYSQIHELLGMLTTRAGFISAAYEGIPFALKAMPPSRWSFPQFLSLYGNLIQKPRWELGNPMQDLPELVAYLEKAEWNSENISDHMRRIAEISGEEIALALRFSKLLLARTAMEDIPHCTRLMFRLLNGLSDFNRRATLYSLHSINAQLLFNRMPSKGILDRMELLVEIFERWPRLGLAITDGILEASRERWIPDDLKDHPVMREKIFQFIQESQGFFPSLFQAYLRGDVEPFTQLDAAARRILQDDFGLEEARQALDSFGMDFLLAAIHRAQPTSGASFVKRSEEGKLLQKMLEAGDLRNHIPVPWRGRTEEFIIPQFSRRLKPGTAPDPQGWIASLLQKLSQPDPRTDRAALVSALIDYLRSGHPPSQLELVQESLYRLAAQEATWRERIEHIDPFEATGLSLLEELFSGRDHLPKILEEAIDKVPADLLVQKGRRRRLGRKIRGLVERLRTEWQKAETETWPQPRRELVIGKIIAPYLVRDLQIQLLAGSDLPLGLKKIIRTVMHQPPRISKNFLLKEILQQPLEIIRRERAKYAPREEGFLQIGLRAVKGPAFSLWGLNAGVCTANDVELWKNPAFKPLAILVKSQNESMPRVEGFVEAVEVVIGQAKFLTLPGINPSPELLNRVPATKLYDGLMEQILTLAQLGGYDGVYIPTKEAYRSNRSEINRLIEKAQYPVTKIPEVQWNTQPLPYPFSEVYMIWERGAQTAAPSPVAGPLMIYSTFPGWINIFRTLRRWLFGRDLTFPIAALPPAVLEIEDGLQNIREQMKTLREQDKNRPPWPTPITDADYQAYVNLAAQFRIDPKLYLARVLRKALPSEVEAWLDYLNLPVSEEIRMIRENRWMRAYWRLADYARVQNLSPKEMIEVIRALPGFSEISALAPLRGLLQDPSEPYLVRLESAEAMLRLHPMMEVVDDVMAAGIGKHFPGWNLRLLALYKFRDNPPTSIPYLLKMIPDHLPGPDWFREALVGLQVKEAIPKLEHWLLNNRNVAFSERILVAETFLKLGGGAHEIGFWRKIFENWQGAPLMLRLMGQVGDRERALNHLHNLEETLTLNYFPNKLGTLLETAKAYQILDAKEETLHLARKLIRYNAVSFEAAVLMDRLSPGWDAEFYHPARPDLGNMGYRNPLPELNNPMPNLRDDVLVQGYLPGRVITINKEGSAVSSTSIPCFLAPVRPNAGVVATQKMRVIGVSVADGRTHLTLQPAAEADEGRSPAPIYIFEAEGRLPVQYQPQQPLQVHLGRGRILQVGSEVYLRPSVNL